MMRAAMLMSTIFGLGVVAGCGGSDDISEGLIERQIESAAEDEGVDVDVDFDDGNLSVQTEDGEFEMTTDDDGNFTISGADGEEQFSAEVDDEGNVSLDTEDGQVTMSTDTEIPEGFPDLPLPDDLVVTMAQEAAFDDETAYTVIGTAPGDWESYLDELTDYLEGNGYTENSVTTSPDGAFFSFTSDTVAVNGSLGSDTAAGEMTLTLAVTPADS
jgi:hypothetical protein